MQFLKIIFSFFKFSFLLIKAKILPIFAWVDVFSFNPCCGIINKNKNGRKTIAIDVPIIAFGASKRFFCIFLYFTHKKSREFCPCLFSNNT